MPDGRKIVQIAVATTVQNGLVMLCLYSLDNYGHMYIYAPPTTTTEEGWRELPSSPWAQPPKPREPKPETGSEH